MARAVAFDDYYSVLEVPQYAALESIRESYKRLALKYHPDKNKDVSATKHFQHLAIAWETLKDETKRRDYDRTYIRTSNHQKDETDENNAGSARKSWNGFERGWRFQSTHEAESDITAGEAVRRARAQAWHSVARVNYLTRLQRWTSFRDQHTAQVLIVQKSLHQQEVDLKAEKNEDEAAVVQKFKDAINRSQSSNQESDDRSTIMAKLLEARSGYITRLEDSVIQSERQLRILLSEFEKYRYRYEAEEAQMRTTHIGRALELLGPRDLNAPLFNIIDRRGRAINIWKALSRIKPATKLLPSLQQPHESPWHMAGDWVRVGGEQTCGRCGQSAFHLIAECGPVKCPGCKMVACLDCHRNLLLLQEYDHWISSPFGLSTDSLFSVVFDIEVMPPRRRGSASGFSGARDTSKI